MVFPKSNDDELRRSGLIGFGAFVLTVLVGFVTVLLALRQPSPAELLLFVVAVALYCVIGTIGAARIWSGGALAKLIYFVVQLALAFLIGYLGFHISDGRNAIWLVLMPLTSQAVSILPLGWAIVVALADIAEFELVIFLVSGEWQTFGLLSFAVSVGFVFLFSLIATREQRSRMVMESLAVQLREANRRLSDYAVQVDELATTRERNRIARDVHDSLGHYLTTVNVQLEAARALLATDPAKSAEALSKAQASTREGLSEVRRSVAALRAGPLDNKPLIDAIDDLVDETRASGLNVNLAVTGTRRALAPQAEMTLYRAAQEGLTNIRKHANAKHVGLLLAYSDHDVKLTIRDDGARAEETSGEGFGLIGLCERAQLLGGSMTTRIDGGFVLDVELPA